MVALKAIYDSEGTQPETAKWNKRNEQNETSSKTVNQYILLDVQILSDTTNQTVWEVV